jgi:hypothetical protein
MFPPETFFISASLNSPIFLVPLLGWLEIDTALLFGFTVLLMIMRTS